MSQGAAVSEYQVEPCPLCETPIVWALDDRAESVPVDAEFSDAGTHALRPMWEALPRAVKLSAKFAFGAKLRQIHYATCVKGKTLRKAGRGAAI